MSSTPCTYTLTPPEEQQVEEMGPSAPLMWALTMPPKDMKEKGEGWRVEATKQALTFPSVKNERFQA